MKTELGNGSFHIIATSKDAVQCFHDNASLLSPVHISYCLPGLFSTSKKIWLIAKGKIIDDAKSDTGLLYT